MIYISPMLNNRLSNIKNNNLPNSDTANHEKTYENLTRHANDVKPNEAKAKLVKENPAQAAVSYFKDLKKDTVNFFKAVKTGKMNDNSLGRINDLGLKAGALLIATFLAAHSKTKTEAVMKYVGGGAFLASMSLWPKLFINLPARLVHGFDIGQKYISAQDEKKDFFLDNQFLPWDAYSDEELGEIGKRMGIDINSENGKEKIQRKMQKTALQNRTLWMATAGFATPLMTALFCDAVEPHIKNHIINSQFKKTKKSIEQLEEQFKNIDENAAQTASSTSKTVIDTLFENNKENQFGNKEFFEKLAEELRFDNIKISEEKTKPIQNYRGSGGSKQIMDALENLYNKKSTITIPDRQKLSEFLSGKFATEEAEDLFCDSKNGINDIIGKITENKGLQNLIDVLEQEHSKEVAANIVKEMEASGIITIDSSEFKNTISEFFSTTVKPARTKLKLYLENALSPAIGEIEESKATEYITDNSLKNLLKKFNLSYDELKKMKTGSKDEAAESVQSFFQNLVKDCEFGSDEYKKIINEIVNVDVNENEKAVMEDMFNGLDELAASINPQSKEETQELLKALKGKDASSLFGLEQYIKEQKANINGFVSRAALCANFEARLKEGLITVDGVGDIRNNPELLKHARKIVYEGNQAVITLKDNMNREYAGIERTGARTGDMFDKLMDAIFNKEAFENEPEAARELIKTTAGDILNQTGSQDERYLRNLDITQTLKNAATNLYNNKSWKRVFVPMAIALAAITLLVQPLFGNIKKEYPEDKKGGKE